MIDNSGKRVLVIGLGRIGYKTAEHIRMKGLTVDGYDTNPKALKHAIEDQVIRRECKNFTGYDFYLICDFANHAPTSLIPYFDLFQKISEEGNMGALVGIEISVPKGTTNQVMRILNHRQHVIHVPHRLSPDGTHLSGMPQSRIISGCSSCCTAKGREFFGDILGFSLHEVPSVDISELCKIVEDSYKYVEIAFAKEIKLLCDGSGLDFATIKNIVNTNMGIRIPEANDTIGICSQGEDAAMRNLYQFLPLRLIEAAKTVHSNYALREVERAV